MSADRGRMVLAPGRMRVPGSSPANHPPKMVELEPTPGIPLWCDVMVAVSQTIRLRRDRYVEGK